MEKMQRAGRVVDEDSERQTDEESSSAVQGSKANAQKLSVLGFDLTPFPGWSQFFICVGGVFTCGVTHDFVQELVFRHDDFDFGWFMTLWELLIFVAAAWLQLAWDNRSYEIQRIQWREYVNLTIVLAATQGSGSVALSYVNFPVKVVMKSSKLIPTMLLGLLIIRRTYSAMEYVSAGMLCLGVAAFTLVDSKVSPKFDVTGIVLLSIAVVGDAFTVNLQEKILRHLQCSKEQMMFASNLMAAGWVLLLICGTGELGKAISVLVLHFEIAGFLFLQALAQYMSVSFYLALIQRFGGVVAVCVTSCRKVLTIVLSFVAFSKPFSWHYLAPGALVMVGISLSTVAKQQHRAPNSYSYLEYFLTTCGFIIAAAGSLTAWQLH